MKRHYPCDLEAKQLIVEIGKRMYAKNMVAANDGNISVKVADDMIWATPTGVSKGFMKEEELVKMKLDGTIVSMGRLKPSSEIKMHLRVYNENPEIGAVTHAHPPVCTGFAIAGIALDKAIYSEALINLGAPAYIMRPQARRLLQTQLPPIAAIITAFCLQTTAR